MRTMDFNNNIQNFNSYQKMCYTNFKENNVYDIYYTLTGYVYLNFLVTVFQFFFITLLHLKIYYLVNESNTNDPDDSNELDNNQSDESNTSNQSEKSDTSDESETSVTSDESDIYDVSDISDYTNNDLANEKLENNDYADLPELLDDNEYDIVKTDKTVQTSSNMLSAGSKFRKYRTSFYRNRLGNYEGINFRENSVLKNRLKNAEEELDKLKKKFDEQYEEYFKERLLRSEKSQTSQTETLDTYSYTDDIRLNCDNLSCYCDGDCNTQV